MFHLSCSHPKDLISELNSELSGGLKKLCAGLCMSPADFDAMNLNKAIKGLGTDEQVLTEIICTRSNQELTDVKAAYKASKFSSIIFVWKLMFLYYEKIITLSEFQYHITDGWYHCF